MLVVLAILAAAAALVVPRLEARNAAVAMAGASTEVRAALRLARMRAIEERRPVIFDAAGVGQYRVDGRASALATSRAAAAIRIQVATGSRISFYPSGGSSGGRVILWGPVGRREIDVSAATGHADEQR
jgi:general secretion pathway protein H